MSNQARYVQVETILSAKAANGVGTTIDVRDYQNIIVSIASASNANLTVKCQGSSSDTSPTFSSAASVTNVWDYIAMYEMRGATLVAGGTGKVYAGADATNLYMVNANGLTFLNFEVSGYAAGNVTVKATLFTNQ